MQFNVSDLLREGYGTFREHIIDDDVVVDGIRRHVTGTARFDRTPEGILVRARLRGAMDAECSRCLKPTTFPVDVEFEEQYVPTIDPLTGARVTPPEGEEDAYRISERHMLDLSEPLRQYWSMALPMAPVCREDCAGLCPNCGEERAPGHSCGPEPIDARWEKLRSLNPNS
jgi:uncharacterized protein